MNDEAVYRTAPATPGLLIRVYTLMCHKVQNTVYNKVFSNHVLVTQRNLFYRDEDTSATIVLMKRVVYCTVHMSVNNRV